MSAQRSVLVLFFHPTHKVSRTGRALIEAISHLSGVTIRDMYAEYPDFLIDVKREQNLLLQHDLIVFQHPVYWYSCPPLLKLWIDDVFEYGWAYGTSGTNLHGKILLSVLTTGGHSQAYTPTGSNRHTIATFFSPIEQTAHLCGMTYAHPFVVHNARALSESELLTACQSYAAILQTFISSGELR